MEPQRQLGGDQLQIVPIFISIGTGVKSIGIFKIKYFFHIKKKEGGINFETYYCNE